MEQRDTRLRLSHYQAKRVFNKTMEVIRLMSFNQTIQHIARDTDTIFTSLASSGVYFLQSSFSFHRQGEAELGDSAIACSQCAAQRQISEPETAQPISLSQNETPAQAFISVTHKDSCYFSTSSGMYSIDEQGSMNIGELVVIQFTQNVT